MMSFVAAVEKSYPKTIHISNSSEKFSFTDIYSPRFHPNFYPKHENTTPNATDK